MEDLTLLAEIDELGELIDSLCRRINGRIKKQRFDASIVENKEALDELNRAEPERWAAWGRDGMQVNLDMLRRAVRQPVHF